MNMEELIRAFLISNANNLCDLSNWKKILVRIFEEHENKFDLTTRLAFKYTLERIDAAINRALAGSRDFREKFYEDK